MYIATIVEKIVEVKKDRFVERYDVHCYDTWGIVEMREDRFVERYVCITQTCRLYIVDQE